MILTLGHGSDPALWCCRMWRLFREFIQFLHEEKKWWLLPLIIVLLLLAALILFSSGSVLAPFMYPFL